jgi:hypothetical protein
MKNMFCIAVLAIIGLNATAQTTATPLPPSITFERTVVQQTNGEDGKATTTYYFTINDDYAMAKHEATGEDEKAMVLYTKDGKMCMIDENKKTIMIMNMPKMMADAGSAVKESMKKHQLPKKDDEEKMTVTKTGKTKTICGYTAYEYNITNEGGNSSWWYAQVDFDPVKIYTMGIANAGIADNVKNNPAIKDNPMAIQVINKNYLWAEVEVAGKKGMETKSISKTSFVFSTAGYAIKEMKNMHKQ